MYTGSFNNDIAAVLPICKKFLLKGRKCPFPVQTKTLKSILVFKSLCVFIHDSVKSSLSAGKSAIIYENEYNGQARRCPVINAVKLSRVTVNPSASQGLRMTDQY